MSVLPTGSSLTESNDRPAFAPVRRRFITNRCQARVRYVTEELQAWLGEVQEAIYPGGVEFTMIAQVIQVGVGL